MDCNNTNQPFNVRIAFPIPTEVNQTEYEVKGIAPIKVETQLVGNKVVFIVSYSPLVAPTASLSVNPSIVEIGKPTVLTFTPSSVKGSSNIVTSIMSPNDLDNNNSKSFTFTQKGIQGTHTFTVTDEEGQTASASASVNVVYRFYKGTITRGSNAIDITFITALSSALGNTIGEALPRSLYTMNKPEGHFIWFYPADFPSIPTPTGDGNFPFALTPIPGTWTIDGIIYKAAKTSTYFTNGATATLGF